MFQGLGSFRESAVDLFVVSMFVTGHIIIADKHIELVSHRGDLLVTRRDDS
jgi:hypothetical protein